VAPMQPAACTEPCTSESACFGGLRHSRHSRRKPCNKEKAGGGWGSMRGENAAGGGNFSVPVGGPKSGGESVAVEGELARQIVAAEGSNEWTLMHRFNKAADLLDQALRVGTPQVQSPLGYPRSLGFGVQGVWPFFV